MENSLARTFVLLVTLCLPVTGSAFSETFESGSLGGWPSAWDQAANVATDPANNKVVLDPTDASNQVLQLHGQINGTWAASASSPVAFPETFLFEIDVYNGDEILGGGHPQRAYIYMRDGGGCCPPSRLLIGFKGDGTVIANDTSVLQTYATNTWYHVAIGYTLGGNNLTLDYWIDGNFLGSFASTVSLATESNLDHINLTAQEGTALFDNVVITPEPSTALLLGLGLAGLARRRRTVS